MGERRKSWVERCKGSLIVLVPAPSGGWSLYFSDTYLGLWESKVAARRAGRRMAKAKEIMANRAASQKGMV